MSQLTVCLANYGRPDQLLQLVGLLKKQTVKPVVFVWDNSSEGLKSWGEADLVISSNRNMFTRPLIGLWQYADTPYVGKMDDDLYPADDRLLEDCLVSMASEEETDRVFGAYGVRLYTGETYSGGQHCSIPKGHGQEGPEPQDLKVDVVKGRILLLNQKAASRLSCDYDHVHLDLHASTCLAGDRRLHHRLLSAFWDRPGDTPRILDFPQDNRGLCSRKTHLLERDKIVQKWAAGCKPHRKVKTRPLHTFSED